MLEVLFPLLFNVGLEIGLFRRKTITKQLEGRAAEPEQCHPRWLSVTVVLKSPNHILEI